MIDIELARRVLAGDETAGAAFFDEYFPRLYRFARSRLRGDAGAAEDVVQATLVLAVRKLHTFRGEAALFTWLCTLCRREIGARLAREGRTPELPLLEDHPGIQSALELLARGVDRDPEAEAGRRELSRLVHVILDTLPDRYGAALEWRYVQGLKVDEIGGRLGVGYKAAESLLSRAREAFREGFALATAAAPDLRIGGPKTREQS
jgi:RNA polymerase sigma-70 factor (ECF subfamily)